MKVIIAGKMVRTAHMNFILFRYFELLPGMNILLILVFYPEETVIEI